MSLICAGVSHHTAPVAVRERLSFPPPEARALLGAPWFAAATRAAGLSEVALLSTCNRTEFYASADAEPGDHDALPAVFVSLLARAGAIAGEELEPHVYVHSGTAAVEHLCRVASGLDSMVVGETEILGQVGVALGVAMEGESSGPVLDAVFHAALRAGRRARAETTISQRPASVAAETVQVLRDRLSSRARPEVLVLGTGAMGRAVARVLHGADFATLRVGGRTATRVREVTTELGVDSVDWAALGDSLAAADAVVTATSAPEPIITERMVVQARGTRPRGHAQLFVDIAVPRNVESSVRGVPDVEVFDLDHLQLRISGNIEQRRTEIPQVEGIIAEELAHFERWRRGSELRPVLASLRARGEAIRQAELAAHLARAGDADPELRSRLDALSRDLLAKLLHEPSRRLRAETDPVRARASAELVRELFDLDMPDDGGGPPPGPHSA
jgi:glutamyl-tRNA reductase